MSAMSDLVALPNLIIKNLLITIHLIYTINMHSKALLIAIAAFAVTATGVHAYGGTKIFSRAGLSAQQIEAFEEARELQQQGDGTRARDVLMAAGVTEETLAALKEAARETRRSMLAALEANDFAAFRDSIADSPLADIVTTEADFQQFRLAHQLRHDGEWKKADAIFSELGVGKSAPARRASKERRRPSQRFYSDLTELQRDALRAARQSNDQAVVAAILEEAGVPSSRRATRIRD